MNRSTTFDKTDRVQFIQIRDSGPIWAGDLISKRSTHKLIDLGFVNVDDGGYHILTQAGLGIADYVEP
jgi:hypothetical protein